MHTTKAEKNVLRVLGICSGYGLTAVAIAQRLGKKAAHARQCLWALSVKGLVNKDSGRPALWQAAEAKGET